MSKGITDLSNKGVTKVLGKTVEFYMNWPPISRWAQRGPHLLAPTVQELMRSFKRHEEV